MWATAVMGGRVWSRGSCSVCVWGEDLLCGRIGSDWRRQGAARSQQRGLLVRGAEELCAWRGAQRGAQLYKMDMSETWNCAHTSYSKTERVHSCQSVVRHFFASFIL